MGNIIMNVRKASWEVLFEIIYTKKTWPVIFDGAQNNETKLQLEVNITI